MEFWQDQLYVCHLKKGKSIVVDGLLHQKENLYKLHDMNQPEPKPTPVSHTNE
jgi:hypothetical protein